MFLQKVRQFLCWHKFEQYQLIFSGGVKTHHLSSRCIKCEKEHTKFSGTREEYRNSVGMKYED